jgi:hypothetical protein
LVHWLALVAHCTRHSKNRQEFNERSHLNNDTLLSLSYSLACVMPDCQLLPVNYLRLVLSWLFSKIIIVHIGFAVSIGGYHTIFSWSSMGRVYLSLKFLQILWNLKKVVATVLADTIFLYSFWIVVYLFIFKKIFLIFFIFYYFWMYWC